MHGSDGPGNMQRSRALFIEYTGPLDPRRDFTTQKIRVANKNRKKIKYCYFMIYNHMFWKENGLLRERGFRI